MNKIYLLLPLCFLSFFSQAQDRIVSSGGDASDITGSVSFSVGQINGNSFFATKGSVSEGVQQPFEINDIITIGVENPDWINLTMSVYPNPTIESIQLHIEKEGLKDFSYSLFDLSGKLLLKENISNSLSLIDMSTFSTGAYILDVYQENKKLKAFKIIKNQ